MDNSEGIAYTFPLEILDSKADQMQVDRNVKKLFGKEMFFLLLMTILENERVCLRVMENLYNINKFQFFAGEGTKRKTKFTSLSDRLINIKAEFLEEVFKSTYQILSENFNAEQINPDYAL